jgi:hypothetical protein
MTSAARLHHLTVHLLHMLTTAAKRVPAGRDQRLSQRVLSQDALIKVKEFCVLASMFKDHLGRTQAQLWGATLMLLGVEAAREYQGGGFSWDDVADKVGHPQARPETGAQYDWIEVGCRKLLKVTLLRASHKRRVLGTMLQQAGACAAHLQELAALIRRRWSWSGLTQALLNRRDEVEQVEVIARWLLDDVSGSLPSGTLYTQILAEEPRYALAAAIRELTTVWSKIQDKGLLRDSSKATLKALKDSDPDAFAVVTEAGDAAADAILAEMFPSTATTATTGAQESEEGWRWRWLEGQGFGHIVLAPPELLLFDRRLPPDTMQVRFKIQGSAQRPDSLPRFERIGDHLKLKQVQSVLLPALPFGVTSALIAEWRDAQGSHQRHIQDLSAPNDPVALFDAQSGESLTAPCADRGLVLVFARGLGVTTQHPAFQRDAASSLCLGVDVWRGVMPQEDVTWRLAPAPIGGGELSDTSDLSADEAELFTLSPPHLRLEVGFSPRVRPRQGLRVHYHPVFERGPQLMTREQEGGEVEVERRGVKGKWEVVHRGKFRVAFENLKLDYEAEALGLYRVKLTRDKRAVTLVFAVLPVSMDVSVERGRLETTVRAVAVEEGEELLVIEPLTRAATPVAVLPPREAPYQIPFIATAKEQTLRGVCWVMHAPQMLRVFDGNDPNQTLPLDISIFSASLLKGTGGLVITGAPRQRVRLIAGEQAPVELDLNRDGRAIWRFYALSPALKQKTALVMSVEWLGPQPVKRELRFMTGTMVKPTIAVVHDEGSDDEGSASDHIGVSLTADLASAEALNLDALAVWMVPAWAPWTEPKVLSAVATERGDKGAGVRARIYWRMELQDVGPYMVGLLCGGRPCSGLTLAWMGHATQAPPEKLSTLSKLLWQPPSPAKVEELTAVLTHRLRAVDAEAEVIRPLMKAISLFGVEHFRISKPFGEAMCRARLQALLRVASREGAEVGEERAQDYRLLDFVRNTLETPWATVRFDDLEAELAAASPEKIGTWLEALDELRAGFLVAAAERFSHHERLLEAVQQPGFQRMWGLIGVALQWPARLSALSEGAVQHLKAPNMERDESEALPESERTERRFGGLMEARLNLLSRDDLVRRLCQHKVKILAEVRELPQEVLPHLLEQKGIPEEVRCVESTIAAVSWQVHRWRARGELIGLMPWSEGELSFLVLQRRFPLLMDFWLNLWAKRDITARTDLAAKAKKEDSAEKVGVSVRRRER